MLAVPFGLSWVNYFSLFWFFLFFWGGLVVPICTFYLISTEQAVIQSLIVDSTALPIDLIIYKYITITQVPNRSVRVQFFLLVAMSGSSIK